MTIQYSTPRASLLGQALPFIAPGMMLLAVSAGIGLLAFLSGLTVAASDLPFSSAEEAGRSVAVGRDMALYTALAGVGALLLGAVMFALALLVRRITQRRQPGATPAQPAPAPAQPAREEPLREREVGGR
jgi:hypothetical protein